MEIDLLNNYPRSKRDTKARSDEKTPEIRAIARKFGQEFFDGDRKYGYGGFNYHSRFWHPVIPDLQRRYQLKPSSSVLDVGCAKGFFVYDLCQLIPGIKASGVDVSKYAITHAKPEVKDLLSIACATNLPFDDNSFDFVMSINTVHNLDEKNCARALQEITRVSNGQTYITVDAYRDDEEKERMLEWNLTAKTIMHVDEWKVFFNDIGYIGDYYWFMP